MTSSIQYLSRKQIDTNKWDACIGKAENGLIYAYSFYLDHMAKQWDALVLNDYEAVMPLPWNSKYGIRYIYQPFLTAQLGVFGLRADELTDDFINAIPSSFRLIELSLNSGNKPTAHITSRSNYILELGQSYEVLYNNYRENIQRNIKKAFQLGCTVQKDPDVEKLIGLALAQMKMHNKESSENADRFRKLYSFLHDKKMASTYGIISTKNELLASCAFFFSHDRAYYILVGNHPDGRNSGASHALIDAFIKDHAGKKMVLDFEGSDIRNLAFFYSGFGAEHVSYTALKINRLPFYLKWMKK